MPCLCEGVEKIKDVLKNDNVESAIIYIGPEGDFTPREVGLAIKSGFIPVSLGGLTLKVDTACIAALAILNYHLTQ